MTSRSNLKYGQRAQEHNNPLVKKLFQIAESKKSNVVVSADLTTTKELLELADSQYNLNFDDTVEGWHTLELGPYIAVFKTHIDIVSDFGEETVTGLKSLSSRHNFMFFEDRKFVDIGNKVQKQYDGGALRVSEWAHIVNASILAGDGIIEAMTQTATSEPFKYRGERGLLILAEMTTKGSLATGDYTKACIESAKKHKDFVIGFVATQALTLLAEKDDSDDDFVVFTTGVNRATKGD